MSFLIWKIIYDWFCTKFRNNILFNLLNKSFCYKIIFYFTGKPSFENVHFIDVVKSRIVSMPVTTL